MIQTYGKRYRPFRADGNRRDIHGGIGSKTYANGILAVGVNSIVVSSINEDFPIPSKMF